MTASSFRRQQKQNNRALLRDKSGANAAPFLKWAGGKSQLISALSRFFPEKFNNFYEPFAGGAAVFFHLANSRRNLKAELSDLNPELINCYSVVKNNPDLLIAELKSHKNNEDYYYEIRALDPAKLSPVERAARIIFLNKTCFNGLYRENSKGQFNVPFGYYKNPNFCNEDLLQACHHALKNTSLSCASFEDLLSKATEGDLVYLDPPYHPLSSTSNFRTYTKSSFSSQEQVLLASVFSELEARGCFVILSNSDCPFIRDLYQGKIIETVYALRAINCKGERRGKISEVLVLSKNLMKTY